MNILIAADYATPASGNFIASCVELGRALKKSNNTLTFIFPENNNTISKDSWVHWLEREGFKVYLTPKDKPDNQNPTFLQSIIKTHQIDILHIHFGMFQHTIMKYAKELGVKLLIHDHMDFPAGCNLTKERTRCIVYSLLYRKNKIAIASVNPHKNSAYIFTKHWYIPNGLSLIRNISKSATKEETRAKLKINDNEKICLFLGWDYYRKGLDIAIKAVNKVRKIDPNVVLGVVGFGNAPGEDCLRFISEKTGIEPNTPWVRYFPSCEDMFAYHRAADVYISASRSEAFSYGILEAISQNTPIVVSNIKGTSWCHKYNKLFTYPTENADACADEIMKALSLGRSKSNADEIVEDFSIEKWCSQMLEIYKSL